MISAAMLLSGCLLSGPAASDDTTAPLTLTSQDYARWDHGVPSDPAFFPIAVWLQAPRNAARYRAAGINVYVGLWRGPTEAQLTELAAADMRVICDQNDVALRSTHAGIVIGWMHGDEPDNAQARRDGKGYDPPILPSKIEADYQRLRQRDPSRPILLNLGQGVAFDNWIGRGVRRNHPEDYAEYLRGCDIASFDIYPVVHDEPTVAGKLEFVPYGVTRLREWSEDRKIVWCCIEASRISNTQVKPTADQVRAEVWMALIHGARGLIYFVHQFAPQFVEASLLEDAELLQGVTALNQQIHALAPVLNSATVDGLVTVTSADPAVPVATMCKQHEGATYLFAVTMRGAPTRATFQLPAGWSAAQVEVLGEDRTLAARDAKFEDAFDGYAVHLYRLAGVR